MKKNILLIFAIIFCLFASNQAQTTIPNGGFEDWQNVGDDDEEPTDWNGNKTGGGFANLGPQTCFRETADAHGGTFCLKLQNGSIFGTAINASVTTGKLEAPTINPADGYIQTVTAEPDFNATFTGRPDSLVGWFKFTQAGTDIGRIAAILHDNYDVEAPDQGGSEAHVVGHAVYDLPDGSSSNWTRFSIPFTYINETTPSYILLVAMATTNVSDANTNTTMWVDDLSVVYSNVGVIENDFGDNLQVFPNPTKGNFSVDLGTTHQEVTIHISGVDGRLIQSKKYQESQRLNLNLEAPVGMYFVTIASENKKAVIRLVKE